MQARLVGNGFAAENFVQPATCGIAVHRAMLGDVRGLTIGRRIDFMWIVARREGCGERNILDPAPSQRATSNHEAEACKHVSHTVASAIEDRGDFSARKRECAVDRQRREGRARLVGTAAQNHQK